MIDQQVSQSNSVWVVIPAAGIGQRMQSELPKQYLKIHNKTIIEHTLDCFLQHQDVAGIVVALSPDDQYWQSLEINTNPIIHTTLGGSNRSDSVLQGLNYLNKLEVSSVNSWVMVHDAARPCLSKNDLDALLAIRNTNSIGGLLASPVRDTMKRSVTSSSLTTVSNTEPRDNLWHALTPQMFRLGPLKEALQQCKKQGAHVTDECSAMEFIAEKPIIVECVNNNIKVTHPSDLELATFLLNSNKNSINKDIS